MGRVYIIDIINRQSDYAQCMNFIVAAEDGQRALKRAFEEKTFSDIQIKTGRINRGFSPRYFEEPLQMSSRGRAENAGVQEQHDFSVDDISMWEKGVYHIRVHFNQRDTRYDHGEIVQLQYLAMLIKYLEPVVRSEKETRRRLTFFIVPKTGNCFPFEDAEGNVDYDTYSAVSEYLRLLSKKYTGVIFGVKKEGAGPCVAALNFRVGKQNAYRFPLILIDEQKYDQLFVNKADQDLEELFLLKSNARFRNADDENPNLALESYIKETDIKRMREVINMTAAWQEQRYEILRFLKDKGGMCLMHFSLFAFLLYDCGEQERRTVYENIWRLSLDLSRGLRQVVQNALQHTQRQECFLTFYLHIRGEAEEKNHFYKRMAERFPEVRFQEESRDAALEIIVSDINETEDMIDNFAANLEYEIQEQRRILGEVSPFEGHTGMLEKRDDISIRNFFAEYAEKDPVAEWTLFRKEDLIAHIGLGQFAQIARSCNAVVKVVSSKENTLKDDRHFFYKSYAAEGAEKVLEDKWKHEGSMIPGTKFEILVPICGMRRDRNVGLSQLRQKQHIAEDYNSFASFLDYTEKRIEVSPKESAGTREERHNQVLNARKKYRLVQIWAKYWRDKLKTELPV